MNEIIMWIAIGFTLMVLTILFLLWLGNMMAKDLAPDAHIKKAPEPIRGVILDIIPEASYIREVT